MPESVTLTAPVNAVAATPRWIVRSLLLDRGYTVVGTTITPNPAGSRIKVDLIGEQGHRKSHQWSGASADADIVALNKANLTSNTLNARILARLVTDGVITGTASGSPD